MNGGKLTVDGTWMTEAHVIAISRPKDKIATASFGASKLNSFNTGTDQVNGTCVAPLCAWDGVGYAVRRDAIRGRLLDRNLDHPTSGSSASMAHAPTLG